MDADRKIAFLTENGVDALTGISNMMDIDTYNEIMDDFYQGIDEELQKINNFKNINDMANYSILVHALKSNARSFGFNKLGEIAYAHELASKSNDINYVNEHYNELLDEVLRVKKIIETYKSL